ncbi:DNA polymerase III subunit gamma/tau [Rhodobacter capsulatus]|jgi:DNA polymerase-3 subunit gamma/tau|uniref:DNA polymerase III subunit gamma/tau n=1 Tax=Rhodobacter capsulatus (strain ATCC BAA-309 / NBRC 16581 / SB1003) TaxID=272942 RepID=D5ANY1_RHOCB|nr:DNA polymerase III subunit gamma/tau [Rhodobacter capsulatus]ADE86486.1 DNA polymerase III, gamma/tau subunit [Rhodobacter capsulatus SB 1003]ETD00723.1 DNA polymerase III subunit gamma/tau [Rhodobacter capsulatus DE442]ETD75354.1 DNA polymerase III subunit gamma/tau [Rhodobacter capsulatus R121]ETE52784.1 DNA polymerase III subunit gamma/tau [Rhodobacter capsulatus Y262]MDS0928292.1 DNA polymerase III subunit gamma/tau [Rhodobacter capsulatus]
MTDADSPAATSSGYQVLARKYRPATFADLIGQEAMVRTLKNAFAASRIAQAFIMTGIRGTGKTTTARIIAKGLNCIGPDGTGQPTTEPCLVCEHCRAIAEGRHVDVLEMDAASRTGVGDIREIIESVNYRAASARYKVYIIDEVHMLSTSAFNALLKTLEEPPAHVKFIFATTEIRKVPVTVLSRCQRFDLRRIEPEVMINHLSKVATKENAQIAEDALALITRAAEGSVRDAMSLLDQAISHGAGETTADQVRAMLGLADRARVLDLFDMILKGDAAAALTELGAQYSDGADPMAVLRDLAEITHWVSVIKITPEAAEDPTVPPEERTRGQAMAQAIPMRVLSRLWQMLLKAIEEVSSAPNAMMAAEMALIRLTHVADLPDPETLMRKVMAGPGAAGGHGPSQGGGGGGGPRAEATTRHMMGGRPLSVQGSAALAVSPAASALAKYARFEDVVALIGRMRDVKLLVEVEKGVRLVHYAPGRIEFEPAPGAPRDLAQTLAQRLQGWTGARWGVSVVSEGGAATIDETRNAATLAAEAEARAENRVVQAIFAAFPTAKFEDIVLSDALEAEQTAEALPEVEDEWDPFEDG